MVVGLAGALWDQTYLSSLSAALANLGFKTIMGQTLRKKNGYFSGTDEERAQDLMDAFQNKSVHGIFCLRGGWGSARILDKIDFQIIKENPKFFMGFSDITSLLLAIHQKTGLVTFHGPMAHSAWNAFSTQSFKQVAYDTFVKSPQLLVGLPENPIKSLSSGSASGQLVGGNLSVLCATLGTDFAPSWEGKILFLEETNEEPYRIDRMLTQLKLNGVYEQIKGLVLGQFNKCVAEIPEQSFTCMEVLNQHFAKASFPVIYNAPIGHTENKWTLPLGILAEINADKKTLTLLENAVT